MASSFSNEPTMTLDKVQYTANAHTTGGRDGASRSAGVKQGDQGVLSPPVDLEDGSKVEIRATPTAKAAS